MSITPIAHEMTARLLSLGRTLPRSRHQRGHVKATGKRLKKWTGYYYQYVKDASGVERRVHRSATLGLKSQMKKWEAEKALADFIGGTGAAKVEAVAPTLGWFWRERYLPMKSPTWKDSARAGIVANIERIVVKPLEGEPLAELGKFGLQMRLNGLAAKYSRSVVEKFRIWVSAILEEAVDQGFIARNPARKLEMPATRKASSKTISESEVAALLAELDEREALMLRMFLVLGLRPGELFALRWDDVEGAVLRIDEATSNGKAYAPKTAASNAFVWMPESIRAELEGRRGDSEPGALVFPDSRGGLLRLDNWRHRVLGPAAKRAELEGITLQACRRTCATLLQRSGTIKDTQAHLRHAQASTTLSVYVQSIPESVRAAVESLDRRLREEEGGMPSGEASHRSNRAAGASLPRFGC